MSKINPGTETTEFENDAPLTQEEIQDEMLYNEKDILASLLGKDDQPDAVRIEVRRPSDKKLLFAFRVRPLMEKEIDKCRDRHTKYVKNKRFGGIRIPERTNTVEYHSDLIYTATIPEDRAKLWDNKTFWNAVNAVTGVDMVEKLIPYSGVKQRIVDKIEEISGYNDEDEDDDLKN